MKMKIRITYCIPPSLVSFQYSSDFFISHNKSYISDTNSVAHNNLKYDFFINYGSKNIRSPIIAIVNLNKQLLSNKN